MDPAIYKEHCPKLRSFVNDQKSHTKWEIKHCVWGYWNGNCVHIERTYEANRLRIGMIMHSLSFEGAGLVLLINDG